MLARSRLAEFDSLLYMQRGRLDPCQLRRQLALELQDLASVVVAFTSRYNSLLPISKLPVEILRHIFAFCAVLDAPTDGEVSSISSPERIGLGWIQLSHVCRRWRDVGSFSDYRMIRIMTLRKI